MLPLYIDFKVIAKRCALARSALRRSRRKKLQNDVGFQPGGLQNRAEVKRVALEGDQISLALSATP